VVNVRWRRGRVLKLCERERWVWTPQGRRGAAHRLMKWMDHHVALAADPATIGSEVAPHDRTLAAI